MTVVVEQDRAVDAAVQMVGRRCVELPQTRHGGPVRIGVVESMDGAGSVLARIDGRQVELLRNGGYVPLPRVGESVELSTGSEVLRGYWLGAVPWGSALAVRVLEGSVIVRREVEPERVDAAQIVTGTPDAALGAALDALAGQIAEAEQTVAAHERWKAMLSAAACDRADYHGYCQEFDQFMEEWGLEGRNRDYSVEVEVTMRCSVSVTASSAEAAEQEVDSQMVRDALDTSYLDWTVKSTEAVD